VAPSVLPIHRCRESRPRGDTGERGHHDDDGRDHGDARPPPYSGARRRRVTHVVVAGNQWRINDRLG
jgi:hypothetical protein